MKEEILYNKDKWLDILNEPKYKEIRNKIEDSFKGLTFVEEGHKYFLDGKEMECVSNVTHRWKPVFNSEAKAYETSSNNWDNEKSKYYRMTPEMILEQWRTISHNACEHGTERHLFGESAFYYMTGQYDKIADEFKDRLTSDGGFKAIKGKEIAVVHFFNDLPKNIIPILAETKVFSRKYQYSGTFDILFYYNSPNGDEYSGLFIMDYKTNKDLYKNFQEETLLYPFDELINMPLNLYKLQLSLYQIPLEDIGLKTVARRILWLREDGHYEKIPLESYTNILREIMEK